MYALIKRSLTFSGSPIFFVDLRNAKKTNMLAAGFRNICFVDLDIMIVSWSIVSQFDDGGVDGPLLSGKRAPYQDFGFVQSRISATNKKGHPKEKLLVHGSPKRTAEI